MIYPASAEPNHRRSPALTTACKLGRGDNNLISCAVTASVAPGAFQRPYSRAPCQAARSPLLAVNPRCRRPIVSRASSLSRAGSHHTNSDIVGCAMETRCDDARLGRSLVWAHDDAIVAEYGTSGWHGSCARQSFCADIFTGLRCVSHPSWGGAAIAGTIRRLCASRRHRAGASPLRGRAASPPWRVPEVRAAHGRRTQRAKTTCQ